MSLDKALHHGWQLILSDISSVNSTIGTPEIEPVIYDISSAIKCPSLIDLESIA